MIVISHEVGALKSGGFAMVYNGECNNSARIELYSTARGRCIDYENAVSKGVHREPSEGFTACLKTITRFKNRV
jgi:hypothetical protein